MIGGQMEIKEIISKMSTEDKIALCSGKDFWTTKAFEKYGIPSLFMAHGPNGLRKQELEADMLGVNESVPATCFPTSVSTACSWDSELAAEIGKAIAREALQNKVGLLLGPGANIKRNPLCGRNFEYFSEDPFLTGKLAAGFIRGAQSVGGKTTLKHFAFNNQEYKRFSSDSVVDESTMREIYLTGFELAVKEGKPAAVMSAYNKINGEHCSESRMLLTDILRDEWGFDGIVVTDWGGMSDRIKSFKNGCELCMPGGSAYMEKEALAAVSSGELDEADIDKSAERILRLVFSAKEAISTDIKADMDEHSRLAARAAAESAVLMKNDGGLLPIPAGKKVVFIGHMAKEIRYQGAGSSHINPYKLVNVTDARPDVPFYLGCDEKGNTNDTMLSEAVQAAKSADIAVVFAGLPPSKESEGFDRDDMKMPDGHTRLIEAVSAANPNTVVVLMCGSPVETPWESKVKSILYMGLSGQEGGTAAEALLFGKAVPCGKLAESWPVKYEDCPSSSYYGNGRKDAHYREGIYVGYRYYSTSGTSVRFPFGHGLSYAEFEYSDLRIEGNNVFAKVTNKGNYAAKEIAQLYIAPPHDGIFRPAKELKGFIKVLLNPAETKEIRFALDDRAFSVWKNGWVVPKGRYEILVGGSIESLPLSGFIDKDGVIIDKPADVPQWYFSPSGEPTKADWEKLLGRAVAEPVLKKKSFAVDNTVMEMREFSLIMKIMFKAVESTVAKGFDVKKDYENPEFRMLLNSAADASLSGMKISGGMNNYVLEGMLAIANGHFFKGLGLIMKKP